MASQANQRTIFDMAKSRQDRQVAALPWRLSGSVVEILLVTTRETQRWVIPKGWPMMGKPDDQAAQIEAYEEAGLHGNMGKAPVGTFSYVKRRAKGELINVMVDVYPMQVVRELPNWPEAQQRARAWYPAETAAMLVQEEDLTQLIKTFADVLRRDSGVQSSGTELRPGFWQRLRAMYHRLASAS